MKPVVLLATIFLFPILLTGCRHSSDIAADDTATGFVGDSGYIYPHSLLQNIKFDTTDAYFKKINIRKNDTVGKYYKGSNGHYFSCLDASDGFEGYLIVETKPDGTIVAQEPYGVGIHSCCWEGRYDGFRKYGDYITFRSCITGTAVCGGGIRLFKALKPQDDFGNVPESLWYADDVEDTYHDLTSTMEIRHDTIFIQYFAEEYTEEGTKRNIINTSKFTIRYAQRGDKWTALDSTKISLSL